MKTISKRTLLSFLAAYLMCISVLFLSQGVSVRAYALAEGTSGVSESTDENVFEFIESQRVISVGEKLKLPMNISDCYKNYIFKSSKPDIVSVDSDGTVTALQKGAATITAKVSNSVYSRCIVRAVIHAEKVTLNQTELTLVPEETFTLKGKVTPSDASYKTLTWESSDESVASVEKGVVTAKGKGSAVITAQTSDGAKAECIVNVKVPVEKVVIYSVRMSLQKYTARKLTAKVFPENADDAELTWSSSNSKIVTVDSSGTIRTLSAGQAVVTAKTANGKKSSVTIEVTSPVSLVTITPDVVLGNGENFRMGVRIVPDDATNKTLTWSSSNTGIVSVDNGVLTANAEGTATITAKSVNGKTSTSQITVKKAPTSVKIESSFALGVGEKYKFGVMIPSDCAANSYKYATSDSSICSVNQMGLVTGVRPGTATITVKTYNGLRARLTVTVKAAPEKIYVDKTSVTLGNGETYRINPYLDSSHASKQKKFSSSNSSVATVDSSGIVTAKSTGTAVITVSAFNGVSVKCTVTVKAAPSSVSFAQSSISVPSDGMTGVSVYFPVGSASNKLTYISSNTSVCTVDSYGTVMGVKEGSAKITVITFNGKKAECTVTVKKTTSGINLYFTNRVIRPGQTFNMKYYLNPGEYTNRITVTSSNSYVCSVNRDNSIIGLENGTVLISVSTHNGKKAVCRVTVSDNTSVLNTDPVNRGELRTIFKAVSQYPELPTGRISARLL